MAAGVADMDKMATVNPSKDSPERSPLEDTEKSLQTLIKLSMNPECIGSLLEGLTNCIQAIMVVSTQSDNTVLEQLVSKLLTQIIQTCHEELRQTQLGIDKLGIVTQLTRLLRLALDMLTTHTHMHFTALTTINRIIDVCIIHQVYHMWAFECDAKAAASARAESCEQKTMMTSHFARISHGSLKVSSGKERESPRVKQASWKARSMPCKDSTPGIKVSSSSSQYHQDTINSKQLLQETSFIDCDGPADIPTPPSTALPSAMSCDTLEGSPLEVLANCDPGIVLGILHNAITTQKKTMGTRHKCTPSVRMRHCWHHCLQILSARVFNVMCLSSVVQQKVMSEEGHIPILVEALDPNHDPHLLCLVLQALACIATNPGHHQALSDADLPDTLMQLLLPSDEWYYTNHSTKYAPYVKYHAARIVVYMGLFHRLGGRVNLFDMKPFETRTTNPLVHSHSPEDIFIDQMALGKLVVKDKEGHIVAGSLEGLIAEVIKDAELELLHPRRAPSTDPHAPEPPRDQPGSFPIDDLTSHPFREYMLHALPLIVHPIIILHVLCHKMFGHMVRRKPIANQQPSIIEPQPQINNLLQTPVETVAPTIGADCVNGPTLQTSTKRRKGNLHVHIAVPATDSTDEEDDEAIRAAHKRTRRAGSMDKHLSSLKRLMMGNNVAMSLAIMAVGDSLMQPLDLNLSPTSKTSPTNDPSGDADAKKRTVFRFPSVKKRLSKSQGYMQVAGVCDSADGCTEFLKDSLPNITNGEDVDMKEFQRELINLPTFEIDTHRIEQTRIPILVSRSNSVPEKLGQLCNGCCIMEKGGRAQFIMGRQHHHRLMHCKVEVTPSSDNNEVTFDKESGSKPTTLWPRDSVSASNLTTDITAVTTTPNGDALTNNIHPDIAFVRPVTTRQRIVPFPSSGPKLLPYPVNVAVTQTASGRYDRNLLRPASSHSSLTSCASSTSVHSDLCSPGYLMAKSTNIDVPAHHQGVLNIIETWIDVCCIDFEFSSMMKKEVKDFFKKMSTLGPEYDTWSQKMQRRLHLEEADKKRASSEEQTDAQNIQAQYKEVQQLIVKGELPCSKEEAASLSGIQLHLEETWPDTAIQTEQDSWCDRYRPLRPGKTKMKMEKLSRGRTSKLAMERGCPCLPRRKHGLARFLPPYYTMSSKVLTMIEEKQTKLWHTPYYDNELKLKQLYIRICKNLPAYDCKLYHMKQLMHENSSKKACILGINSEKFVLLDSKTKTPLRTCPILDLQQWSTGNGKGHSGLVLEFRGSKPWNLVAPSVDDLKSVTSTLWDVMDISGRFLERTPLHRDVLNFDFSRRHLAMKCAMELCTVHSAELERLQNLLHFPEEVAMSLTDTEFELFNSVPAAFYVRHVTLDLSRTVLATRKPNVQDLIQRFHEVNAWITHIIVTQPTHDSRKAVLSCILRVAQTCWNIGNFNGAIEILAGLKSDKLEPFWLSIRDEDLSIMNVLSDALLSREPTPAYRAAILRALAIPGCKVVPFFGGFLQDLRTIFSVVPSVVVLATDEAQQLQLVTEFNGEDRFMTRIGVGGLVNMDKVRQAHVILNDIHLFHKRAAAMASHAQGKKGNSPDGTSLRSNRQDLTSSDADSDYDLDISSYQPIQPIGNDHQVMLIAAKLSWTHYHDLQCMHQGTTAVRCDSLSPQPFNCCLLLENDNATLSWSHPSWSSLNKGGATGLSPDYDFKGVDDLKLPPGICSKYQEEKAFLEGPDEGHIDLDLIKEVIAGETSADPDPVVDLAAISRQHGLPDLAPQRNCLTIVYGRNLADNRFLKFALPERTARVWFRGLNRLIQVAALQRRRTDKRVNWLKKQYLQLYFDCGRCHGPTPAEALKVFGGRTWVEGSASPRKPQYATTGRNATVKPTRTNFDEPKSRTRQDESTTKLRSPQGDPLPNAPVRLMVPLPSMIHPLVFPQMDGALLPNNPRSPTPNKTLMQPSHLDFVYFVNLFRSFCICSRKDLKDLFEQFATTTPRLERKMPKELLNEQPPSRDSGLMTRNSKQDLPSDGTHKKMCDVVASASVLCNSAGLESLRCKCLGVEELREFLATYQEEPRTEWAIMELIQRHETDAKMRALCKLSFGGFARFLMDKDNYAFVPEKLRQPDENMKHPMSHYYIASSHNTYLPGRQVGGDSSVEMYSQVLRTGCRCIELDCWDGDDGYPVITHGGTISKIPVHVVSKVPFRAVVEAINRSAFETSPYPVILSLENHCSIGHQQKMADIFVEVFGDKLVRDYLFETDVTDNLVLPSPDQLKYRILIKNKKIGSHHMQQLPLRPLLVPTTNGTFDDDDEEEDEFEDDDVPDKAMAECDGDGSHPGTPSLPIPRRDSTDSMGRGSRDTPPGGSIGVAKTRLKSAKKKVAIAESLSNLVIYTIAVKFDPGYIVSGLKSQRKSTEWSQLPNTQKSRDLNHNCYQLSSLSESKMKTNCLRHSAEVINYTERHLMRTYPGAWRIDSSNPNPLTFWACGIQLVALNYQKDDQNMHINTAMFEQNAHCGYVLKPSSFREKTTPLPFNPFGRDFDGLKPTTLTIHLISGQYVFPHHDGSPQVEVEILGIPVDLSKIRSLPVSKNSVNPIWNEAYTFQIHAPELAFVRFGVMDTRGNENVTAQRVIPLKCLRPGYRHVRLRTSTNQPLDMATLFIYSSTTKQTPVNVPRRSFLISVFGAMTDAMRLTVTQDTTVREAMQLLLVKLGKAEDLLEHYELLEEVYKAGEKEGSKTGVTTRVLGMNDRVLQTQNKRKGRGKFLLQQCKRSEETSTGSTQFRVRVCGMSETQDYTILELPITATVQDVIIRALAKARRSDAPDDVLLQMELGDGAPERKKKNKKTKIEILDRRSVMFEIQKRNPRATFHLTQQYKMLSTDRGVLRRQSSREEQPKPTLERKSRRNTISSLISAKSGSSPSRLSPSSTSRSRSKSPGFNRLFSRQK